VACLLAFDGVPAGVWLPGRVHWQLIVLLVDRMKISNLRLKRCVLNWTITAVPQLQRYHTQYHSTYHTQYHSTTHTQYHTQYRTHTVRQLKIEGAFAAVEKAAGLQLLRRLLAELEEMGGLDLLNKLLNQGLAGSKQHSSLPCSSTAPYPVVRSPYAVRSCYKYCTADSRDLTAVLAVKADLTAVLAVKADLTAVLAVKADLTAVLAVKADLTAVLAVKAMKAWLNRALKNALNTWIDW
jgi:hypothetical protein